MKTMKRTGMIVLVITLIVSMFTFASASGVMYTTGKCNLRRGPGLDYGSITTIPADARVTYTSTKKDERSVTWYKVGYNGETGWVSQLYLCKTKGGSAVIGSVKLTGREYLRQTPNQNGKQLGTVAKGTTLKYYAVSTDSRGVDWYLVHYSGNTGWVSEKYTGGDTPAKEVRVYATDGRSYIRKEANLNGKVLCTLERGSSAKYEGSTKYDDRGVAWYKVSYDGKTGWVSSRYTTKK